MLSAVRLKIAVSRNLRMLRRPQRPLHTSLRLMSSSADDRHTGTRITKAVIFDMGGVLIPSPLPFLAGIHSAEIFVILCSQSVIINYSGGSSYGRTGRPPPLTKT